MIDNQAAFYDKKEMYNITELAARWGVSRQSIYNWIEAGKIPAFRFGFSKAWHIPLADIKRLEQGEAFAAD